MSETLKELNKQEITDLSVLEDYELNTLTPEEHLYGLLIINKYLQKKEDYYGSYLLSLAAFDLIQFDYQGRLNFQDKDNHVLYYGFVNVIKKFDTKNLLTKIRMFGVGLALVSMIYTKNFIDDIKYPIWIASVALFVVLIPYLSKLIIGKIYKKKYHFSDDYVFDVIPKKWLDFKVEPVEQNENSIEQKENNNIEEVEIVKENDSQRDN